MKKFGRILSVFLATLLVVVLAACSSEKPAPQPEVKVTAQDLVNLINIKDNHNTVSSNFTVPGKVTTEGVEADVNWTSKNEASLTFVKASDGKTWEAVIEKSLEGVKTAEFTASVEYGGATATKDFKVKVAKKLSDAENLQFMYDGTLKKDDAVEINGFLGWKEKYNSKFKNYSAYIIDINQQGGFYAFRVSAKTQEEYDAIKVNDPITISGKVASHNGVNQIGQGGKIVKREGTPLEVQTPVNLTEAFKTVATEQKYDSIKKYSNALVTVDQVTVRAKNEIGTDTTKVLVAERAGMEISAVVDKYMHKLDGDDAKAIANKAMTFSNGQYVSITGYLTWFNGVPQIAVLNADGLVNGSEPSYTDADKANSELYALAGQFSETLKADGPSAEFELKTMGSKWNTVAVSYAIKGEAPEGVTLTDNILKVTKENESKVTLTMTATIGETVKTKDVNVTIMIKELNAWEKFFFAKNGDELQDITGLVTVSNVRKATTTGDDIYFEAYAVVQDEFGAYYVRMTSPKNATAEQVTELKNNFEAKFKLGYNVTISGAKKDVYQGLHQLKYVDLAKVTLGEQGTAVKPLNVTELVGNADALLKHQSSLVTITGVLSDVKKGYKDYVVNATLTVGDKTIKYETTDKYGEVLSLEALKAFEGKQVTITGIVAWNGFKDANEPLITPVTAEGSVVEYVAPTDPTDPTDPVTADATLKYTGTETINMKAGENGAALLNANAEELDVQSIKNEAGPEVGLNGAGNFRLYNTSGKTNGGALNVKALGGKTISKIIVKIKGGKDTECLATITGHEGNIELTGDWQTVTVEFATPVTEFEIKNVSSAKSHQVWMEEIQIFYAA